MWVNFLASAAGGSVAAVEPAAAWAQANRLWHIVAALRLAQGRIARAAWQLATTRRRSSEN